MPSERVSVSVLGAHRDSLIAAANAMFYQLLDDGGSEVDRWERGRTDYSVAESDADGTVRLWCANVEYERVR